MTGFTPVELLRNGQHPLTNGSFSFIKGLPHHGVAVRPCSSDRTENHELIRKEVRP